MDQKQIEETLRNMSGARCDASDFRNGVWREIRRRRALGEPAPFTAIIWLATLRRIFAPTAMAGLAVATLVAWVVGSAWGNPENRRAVTTTRVLDLAVFGPQADGLVHGRLVVNR